MSRKEFLDKHKDLFWHFNKTQLEDLSDDILVEYILNYGDEKAVKELIDLLGIHQVAAIFFRNTKGKRINYLPEVQNFFYHYFLRNAS
jgi:hypothetical protein